MKLKFYKSEDNDCVKIITKHGKELEFEYIEMIRHIFNDKEIEEADIDDQYSEEERESIRTLISGISTTIETLFSDENENEI
ncbi:hypothetical protein [Peptostreptococcus canis]|uniref:Uncharacterized protein n=1 Tax=Peptostreptococcus canis TaxID=1159213 RepID=A0ABR6TIP4_9FIRM|nr:hypothetical protein [Peptostreptococcus canis]MBC2575254.1 hypothetical protein [Peptostreptococcus canis]MBP1997564.1 hypothetical protein [Peptostreptococcus canis]